MITNFQVIVMRCALWVLDFLGALLFTVFLGVVGLLPFLLAVLLCSCSSFDPPEPGEGAFVLLENGEGLLIYSESVGIEHEPEREEQKRENQEDLGE